MGRIQIVLSDDLEKKFRDEVFKNLGMKKGNMSLAIEEAIKLWIETRKEKRSEAAKKAWETRKSKESSD
jgi:hypothetical protein